MITPASRPPDIDWAWEEAGCFSDEPDREGAGSSVDDEMSDAVGLWIGGEVFGDTEGVITLPLVGWLGEVGPGEERIYDDDRC